jgi:hypothetical protein
MCCRFILSILFLIGFAHFAKAQNRPELFFKSELKNKNAFSFDSELTLEIMQDQLRPENNPNKSNIRNLSLGLNYKKLNNKIRFEILGDQNPLTNDVNVSAGEFYVISKIKNSLIPSQLFVGATKLEYGILNEFDGVLSFLPSYYSVLYDLPRGIDTGFGVNTLFFDKKLSLSSFLFLGRNLRQVDAQNQRLDVAPHHFKISLNENRFKLSLNYFSRKYETQALIQGLGLEFTNFQARFFKSWLVLNLSSEIFSLKTSLNGVSNKGIAGLVHPELELKSLLFRTVFAFEQWTQNGRSATESYTTLGLGYKLNENIKAYFEQSQIINLTNNLVKQDSYQFRIISQWNF